MLEKIKPYQIEPLTEKDVESCDEIRKTINCWFNKYTNPGPKGIIEAKHRADLASLYTPQERFIRKLYEQLDKEVD